MAPRRGFSRGTVVRGVRRITDWGFGPGGSAVTTISGTATLILGSGIAPVSEGFTVVRTRGSFQAFLRLVDAVNGGFHCGVGIGVTSDKAFGVGATAVPGPLSEMEWDGWMYHRIFDLHAPTATFDGAENQGQVQIEIDSKAMRKMDAAQVMFMALETVESGTATASIFAETRVLVKSF